MSRCPSILVILRRIRCAPEVLRPGTTTEASLVSNLRSMRTGPSAFCKWRYIVSYRSLNRTDEKEVHRNLKQSVSPRFELEKPGQAVDFFHGHRQFCVQAIKHWGGEDD